MDSLTTMKSIREVETTSQQHQGIMGDEDNTSGTIEQEQDIQEELEHDNEETMSTLPSLPGTMMLMQNLEKAAGEQEGGDGDEYDDSVLDEQENSSEALLSYH